ncbi:MAG TPA: hypothetical protein VHZ76_01955 [Gammaproteobacteria bacterium]|jgi:hypothetical protein|nr:hypothetical protein [Gammaproteobacteria bacterium]
MIKQVILLLVISIGIVLGMEYAQPVVQLLVDAHEWVSNVLTEVFSGGQAGNIARGLIALLSIPLLLGLIPTLIYWMVKRHWFPYFMEIVWVVWLVQAGALVAMSQSVI